MSLILAKSFFVLLAFVISFAGLGVGIWEAITAQNNNPKNTDYHGDMIQGYAFTIVMCVLNILYGTISFFSGIGLCLTDGEENSKGKKNTSEQTTQLIVLGVKIWGLVMYFNNYELGPFQKIIFAEMIIFFATLGIVVFIITGACCFACCGCCNEIGSISVERREPNFTKIPTNTEQTKESTVNSPELTKINNV